jgi:hypothetical protein
VLEAQPLDGVAGVNVDNQQATPCDSVLFGQAFVEREPGKTLALARSRQSDDSVAANESEPPGITGTKADRRERATGRIDGAEFAGAGIQQPKLSVVESRRVRHGKAAGHNLAARHIDHDAAVVAPVAPAVGNIRAAHCSDKRGTSAVHCESVKVAPILRRQRGQEFRSPQRPKTCRFADCRQAAVQRIDKDRTPRAINVPDPDVMDVDPANDAAFEGYELAVRSRWRGLAVAQHILEPPQHVESTCPERLTIGPQALTLLDDALMGADASVGLAADEKQPAGLVRRERETGVN